MDITNLIVGQKIKSLRLELGESMEKFGERFNTSKGTVNNWEKGRNLPNKENLAKLAKLSNSSVGDFLYSIPDKNQKQVLDRYIDENIKDPKEKEFIEQNFYPSNEFEKHGKSATYLETRLEVVKDDFKIQKMIEHSSPMQIMEYIDNKMSIDFVDSLSTLVTLLISHDFKQSLNADEKGTLKSLILKFYLKEDTIDDMFETLRQCTSDIVPPF